MLGLILNPWDPWKSKIQSAMVYNLCECKVQSAMLASPFQATTLESLIDDWNATLPERTEMVKEWNKEIESQWRSGMLEHQTVLDSIEPLPRKLEVPGLSWIRAWKASWGWAMLTRGGDEQAWLPYTSSDMQAARNAVAAMFTKQNVDKRLLLNYDQLWRNSWSCSKLKLCYKGRRNAGKKTKKIPAGQRVDKKVHSIKGARQSLTVTWVLC